jgi:hypothetical protein
MDIIGGSSSRKDIWVMAFPGVIREILIGGELFLDEVKHEHFFAVEKRR